MGKRATQQEIARASAMLGDVNPSPQTDEAKFYETTTRIRMEQVLGLRNIPGKPPHIQRRILLEALKKSPPKENGRVLKGHEAHARHQSKPRGRSHHIPAFKMA